MKIILTSFLLLALLVNVGCTDPQLVKLSRALDDTATAMATLQTTVIQGNKQGLVTDTDTEIILRLCFKINAGGQKASEVTRALTKLTAPASSSILQILSPIIVAVNDAVQTGVAGIKDANTKNIIFQTLVAIQTALNTAQVILAATGGK
jgi:hypothetical protein